MSIDLSQSPYFDDYDASKNYYKILFTPGRAVQAREFNQMQTLFQEQIKSFGDHVFKNGSMVIPGESNYNLNYEFVTVRDVVYSEISEILETNQVTITGKTSGVVAQIKQYQPNVGADPITFYLQYLNGSEDGTISRFQTSEQLELTTSSGITFAQPYVLGTGVGSVFTIKAGVFYINGVFVESYDQSIILSRYSSEPNVIVGFRLYEQTIDWTQDQTLLDNSNGSTNLNAIGADRLKLTLNLESHDYDSTFDKQNFIQLASFKDGVLQTIITTSDYSVLEDTLARRTYDESGDYTVESFGLEVREHLNTGSNGGLYTVDQGGDDNKFVLGVEPGKAYVRGYEITNIATKYLEADKARDIGSVGNSTTTLKLGAYIEALTPNTTPLIGKTVRFYSGTPSTPGAIPSGTVLGYGLLVATSRNSSGTLNLYLVRIRKSDESNDTSFIASANSIYIAGSPNFTSTLTKVLQDTSNYGLLYQLPVNNVKTLLGSGGVSDTSLTTVRQITATADTSGTVILTSGTNETFVTPSVNNAYASFGSTIREIASISTLGGTPVGRTLTITLGSTAASLAVTVSVQVSKQISNSKTKTLTQSSTTLAVGSVTETNRFYLGKADVVSIVSIVDGNSVNVSNKYTLKRNAQQDFYGVSYITPNIGESLPSTALTVTFNYFIHGTTGDYFSVDSYSVPYEDIPSEVINGQIISAANLLDFRPRKPDNNNNDFSGTGFNSVEVPFPYSLMRADIDYYLPRIDKVYLDSKGNFGIIKGVPDNDPKEPKTPDNSMLLYRVNIPAYTYSIKDIAVEMINNRRYTMRDIGKLDDRISNLEYYVTLSLLENETSGMQITDQTTGLNRFKNGFVTDSFVDHSVGNYTSSDYKCSVSPEYSFLRPEFSADQIDMSFSTAKSNAVLTGDLITLPYTEVNFLTQSFASNTLNVNPYAVYRWNGDMTLSPNNDTWFDNVYTAPQVTYQVYNNGNLSQTWNSWSLNWTGSQQSSSLFTYYNNGVATTTADGYTGQLHDTTGSLATTTTSTSVQVVGDRIVDTSVIPYMRTRNVVFKAVGLKPLSKMYAFFDNVNVGAYCKQDGKAYGADLVTDSAGKISGTFTIPNNSAIKFRTGSKQFTLNDNPTNTKETSLAYSDATYTAAGTLVTRTQSILATQKITQTVVPYDPLAQSFFVEKDGGVFLTSVDLFFASKDANSPVTLEIRNMVNGSPGQDVVPYSKITLTPSQVNVSTTANVLTKFTFASPVYLGNGNEYCFVVMSNSNNYNVYIATMGNKVIGSNAYISKQPFVGVLFKSQNNTTWSEDQNSDMKFNINTAKFTTNQVFNAAFVNGTTQTLTLDSNPLTSVVGTKNITANVKNHNLFVGSKVTIAGIDVGPGIPLSELNKQQTVTSIVDADNFVFQSTTNATSTGAFGGANVTSEHNMLINTIYPSFQELLIENTNVDWTFSGVTGKSISGTETPYVVTPEASITPNINSNLDAPVMIPSLSESAMVSGDFMTITAKMSTYADNISPVIDINRAGVIGIVNRINSPTVLSETAASGGNAIARYITKIIGLTTSANSLKVYTDINKPQGSDVQIFFRTGNSEEEVNNKTWTVLPTIVSVVASDAGTFSEAQFGKDSVGNFGFFQFKIVMLSTSSSAVPSCKRFRGLALGT